MTGDEDVVLCRRISVATLFTSNSDEMLNNEKCSQRNGIISVGDVHRDLNCSSQSPIHSLSSPVSLPDVLPLYL